MSETKNTVAASKPLTPEEIVTAALMNLVAGNGSGGFRRNANALDTRIQHAGDKITLPERPTPMTISTAISTLEDIQEDEETEIAINEEIRGYHYLDGLMAFNQAMRDVFGFTKAVTVHTFFGSRPPVSVDIQVGPNANDIERVLSGRFVIPGVSGHIDVGSNLSDGVPSFVITGKTKKKFQLLFTELATRTREIVATNSIFRNRAFELRFDDYGNISSESPKFLDVSDAGMPIFSQLVESSVEANIFNPIRYSARCRELGIPLKRGVLLEGPYGTGKTMLSKKTGQIALENGWTFLKLVNAKFLPQAVKFARRFQPAVLFLEDMDEVIAGEDRDERINEILNTIDGVDSKSVELMVVFTSNHADQINQAMMRPGRLDAIIQISPPDADACVRLLNLYGGSLLIDGVDYSEVGKQLAGTSSAVIREVVERAKLYALSIEARDGSPKGGMKLTPEALLAAAETMKRQMELLAEKPVVSTSPADAFLNEIVRRVTEGDYESDLEDTVENIDRRTRHIERHVCN